MNSQELREKFIKFFEERGHKVIPSASLMPENDPTVLFTTAGMQPLVPYLLGESHTQGKRLVDLQKCIRTVDVDNVGDPSHLTFFEMMGYWSLGDYWKKEAISFTYEFITKTLGVDPNEIGVSCFAGEEETGIPKDEESAEVWRSLGVADERIAFLPREENFWGPAGEEGPCGPDSEIYVWTGEEAAPAAFDANNKLWMEIGNDVFMKYNKSKDGKYSLLDQKNVDFGAGYERILAYLEGKSNVYETELFEPILKEIEAISGKKYSEYQSEFRIIADHIKASTFIIGDGVVPSNKDRGYVLRRLIRRAVVKAHQAGINENFTTKLAEKVFEIYNGVYFNADTIVIPAQAGIQENEVLDSGSQATVRNDTIREEFICSELNKEETKFRKTLRDGLKLLAEQKEMSGKVLFDLYQSFGLPLEISLEEGKNRGFSISNETIEQFNDLMRQHQELSRTASAGMFKGGLADAGEITTKYHTATHLLLAALRQVLGDHVYQKGSNITAERMRFDFSHTEKMTPEQIERAEDIVNEKIKENIPVEMEEMSVEEAKHRGAMGVFGSKYGEKVKVYTIGPSTGSGSPFSREICGGPHVANTGELGHFKIQKEESSSSGVRRIKAILE